MSRPEFKSGFADEINHYIDSRVASGRSEKSFSIILKSFDTFFLKSGISSVAFSRADADAWTEKRPNEATTPHYARVNKVKNFLDPEIRRDQAADRHLLHTTAP